MKYIFITVLEGVEVKNILRTSILDTLLTDNEVKLVLFMKSQERVLYYQKEFPHPQLIYEVIERKRLIGLDKLFTNLKFTFLRTETTISKRYIQYQEDHKFFLYVFDSAVNWFFSRRLFATLYRRLDYLLIKNDYYSQYFDKYKPKLIFLAHLFDELEIDLLREAKKRKVKSVALINSWDKVTSRSIIRQEPDSFIVFNNIVKEELIKYGNIKKEKIFVSGLPQYDYYFGEMEEEKNNFFEKAGIPSDNKLIVYAPLGSSFSDSDWQMIDYIHTLHVDGKLGKKVSLLVRFQPNDFINDKEIKSRPWLLWNYPGKRFGAKRGVDWDMDENDLLLLLNTLKHMSLLICYASSLSIDAAVFDKPIINLGFELTKTPPSRSALQYFEREHYKKALNTGGIRLVKNENELIGWVNKYLENPTIDSEARKKLVEEQVVFTDGKSGDRIGKYLLSQLL